MVLARLETLVYVTLVLATLEVDAKYHSVTNTLFNAVLEFVLLQTSATGKQQL